MDEIFLLFLAVIGGIGVISAIVSWWCTRGLRQRVLNLEQKIGPVQQRVATDSLAAAPMTSSFTVVDRPASFKEEIALTAPQTEHASTETFATGIAKVGIAILAIGVLYFLSYINSRDLIGPTAKYIIGLVAGAACIGVGELVKNKSAKYAQIIRGGGFIIWFITLYVGAFIYGLVSLPVTLGLIVGVLIVAALVSLAEKKETSFFIGVLGAYIVPWVAGVSIQNSETNLQLLVYTLVINFGIIGISVKQSWKASMYAGFIFTWIMFISIFDNTQLSWLTMWLFASLYGLQYLVVFVMSDIKRSRALVETGKSSSGGEVFLTATNTFIYSYLSYWIIQEHLGNYLGFLALILGLFHFGVYLFIRSIQDSSRGASALTHFVIFVVLVTAAIPIQFDGPIVTMIWFLEGVVLAYMATTKEFKEKSIMYVLGFGGILAGIIHMISFGKYDGVAQTGVPVFNQQYIVWFFVVAILHGIAFLWKKVDIQSVQRVALSLFLVAQIFFVILSTVEIWSYYQSKSGDVHKEVQVLENTFVSYYGYRPYDEQATPAQLQTFESDRIALYDKAAEIQKMSAFVNAIFFVLMTVIYLLIGLLGQNKMFRRLGVVMLIITLIQIVTLVWQLGPVYRFVTFSGFGIVLLILSYLYIRHSKKVGTINPNPTNEVK